MPLFYIHVRYVMSYPCEQVGTVDEIRTTTTFVMHRHKILNTYRHNVIWILTHRLEICGIIISIAYKSGM